MQPESLEPRPETGGREVQVEAGYYPPECLTDHDAGGVQHEPLEQEAEADEQAELHQGDRAHEGRLICSLTCLGMLANVSFFVLMIFNLENYRVCLHGPCFCIFVP